MWTSIVCRISIITTTYSIKNLIKMSWKIELLIWVPKRALKSIISDLFTNFAWFSLFIRIATKKAEVARHRLYFSRNRVIVSCFYTHHWDISFLFIFVSKKKSQFICSFKISLLNLDSEDDAWSNVYICYIKRATSCIILICQISP